jgi:hypothetical protein
MRSRVRIPLAVMLGLFLAISMMNSPAQAAPSRSLFSGAGYGSFAFVGQTVMSGRTAFVALGCQAKAGAHVENAMQSNQEEEQQTGGSMSTGSVRTSADAIKNKSTTKTLTTATANGVNLLKGRITASRVRSVSATFTSGDGMRTSPSGTVLSDLVVDGDAFRVEPGPNTKVTLAGVGYVVLNEQFSNTEGPRAFLIVNGIHVYVTEQRNPLGIPVGTQYIVGHATSALQPGAAGSLGGTAYGHKLFEGKRMQSGPSAVVYMPCQGTGGKEVNNTSGSVQHRQVFAFGAVKTTGVGRVTSKSATSLMAASVDSVSLLSGLVTADSVTAKARAAKKGKSRSFRDAGSEFVNLVVAGRPMGSKIAANTRVPLPGIGTLWLHRVIRGPNSIEVRMIELEVKQDNPFGLTPGSKLQVAVARALVLS